MSYSTSGGTRTLADETRSWAGRPPDERLARDMVLAAAQAYRSGERAFIGHLDALAAFDTPGARATVERALAWWVESGLDRAWGSGWQPADVVRMVRRSLSPAHTQAVAARVAESAFRRPEHGSDDRWVGQVAAIRAGAGRSRPRRPWRDDLALVLQTISLLLVLPPLPSLGGTGPGGARSGRARSGAMLERIRALLAKAESTNFPEEAEALTAKAQQLMARHAIDEAMLDGGRPAGPNGVVGWRISVDDPYAAAKSILLAGIARANRSRAVWHEGLGFSAVFGTRADLAMVEMLFTSLLVQGTDAMMRAGRSVDYDGRSRTRSFRRSFLMAYAVRIGQRLSAATAQAVAEGTERHGEALLPVLAGRAEEVEEAVQEAYPRLSPMRQNRSVTNYAGWVAGHAAAELARLGAGDELSPG